MRTAVSKRRRNLAASREKVVHLFFCHRLPPVRIDDLNLPLQGPEAPLFASGSFCAHDIYDGDDTTADGDGISVLDGLDKFRELVLGIRHDLLHFVMLAYLYSYVNVDPSWS